jgi:hypothetical protein
MLLLLPLPTVLPMPLSLLLSTVLPMPVSMGLLLTLSLLMPQLSVVVQLLVPAEILQGWRHKD